MDILAEPLTTDLIVDHRQDLPSIVVPPVKLHRQSLVWHIMRLALAVPGGMEVMLPENTRLDEGGE